MIWVLFLIMFILMLLGQAKGSPPKTDDREVFIQEAPGRFLNCVVIFVLMALVSWLAIVMAAAGALGG